MAANCVSRYITRIPPPRSSTAWTFSSPVPSARSNFSQLLRLRQSTREGVIKQLLHLARSLARHSRLLAAEFTLLPSEFAHLSSEFALLASERPLLASRP